MSDSMWSAYRDEDLVRLASAGEAQAFGELAQRYRPAMLALAERYVGRNSGAEDIVQDSLLLAHRSLGSLRNPSRVAAWLHAVTRRRATLYLRGAKRVTPHADMEPFLVDRSDMPATGADVVVKAEAVRALTKAMESLPEELQTPLRLFYWDDMPQQRIAAFLDIPLTTVKWRLQVGKQKLRMQLATWEDV
ncbi:MAG: RNA polymerase sigma factor [Candidatus Poribacteria bacterium]